MRAVWTRRQVLQAGVVLLLGGCERRYIRPAGDLYLGPVSALLYPQQFIRERAVIVFRDDNGWSALSTRCTYEGCELSYQEERLLCLCCRSVFNHSGQVLSGSARDPLPWFEIRYGDGALYAVAGKIVPPSYRFMTPELEVAIDRVWQRMQVESAHPGAKIPPELLGNRDPEFSGSIFQPQGKRDREDVPTTTVPLNSEPSDSPPKADRDPLSD